MSSEGTGYWKHHQQLANCLPCSDFSPGLALYLCWAFPCRHTRAVPQGSRAIRPLMASRTLSPLPRQKSRCQAEAATWLKTRTGAGQWVLSLAHLKGIRQEFANRGGGGGVKACPGSPLLQGRRVSCRDQEDHTFPSMAAVPSTSGEGVSATGGIPLPEGN